jgi:hypothetical protein
MLAVAGLNEVVQYPPSLRVRRAAGKKANFLATFLGTGRGLLKKDNYDTVLSQR